MKRINLDTLLPKAHKTFQPNTYYMAFTDLPAPIRLKLKTAKPELKYIRMTSDTVAILTYETETTDESYIDFKIELGQVNLEDDGDTTDDFVLEDRANDLKEYLDFQNVNVYFEVY